MGLWSRDRSRIQSGRPGARFPDSGCAGPTTLCCSWPGLILPEKTSQRHLSIEQAERQKRDFFECGVEQIFGVAGRRRDGVDQADLLQVIGRNGKRDGVADGFVETVIGAILEKRRLIFVGALVEIVAEFVVDGVEVFGRRMDADFDAQIVLRCRCPRRWRGRPRRDRRAW